MSDDLATLVKRGKAKAFHKEVRKRLENDGSLVMEAATFSELTLTGFDFSDLDMSYCAFEDCTLSQCRFVDTTLEGAFFDSVTLLQCIFEEGNVDGWAIDASTIGKCTFKNLALDRNEWMDSRFNEVTMEDISSEAWWMERVTFEKGAWSEVSIDEGAWSHVTFRNMSIDNWEPGDLTIKNCYHVGATLDAESWPDGFIEKSGRRKAL